MSWLFKKNKDAPSCSNCRYATEYPIHYMYPYTDPYCAKGHGACKTNKLCGDYKLIYTYYCSECQFLIQKENKYYCKKKKEYRNLKDDSCVYLKKK